MGGGNNNSKQGRPVDHFSSKGPDTSVMGADGKNSILDRQGPLVDQFTKAMTTSLSDLTQITEAWRKCSDKKRAQFIEDLISEPGDNAELRAAKVAFVKNAVAEGVGKGLSSQDPSLQTNMLKYLKDNNASAATPNELAAYRVITQKPGR